jgi:hypothetical protein
MLYLLNRQIHAETEVMPTMKALALLDLDEDEDDLTPAP